MTKITVLTGKAKLLPGCSQLSGISKTRVEGSITLNKTGLDGDEQADTKIHGGLEKALHHYPFEHYDFWRNKVGHTSSTFSLWRIWRKYFYCWPMRKDSTCR